MRFVFPSPDFRSPCGVWSLVVASLLLAPATAADTPPSLASILNRKSRETYDVVSAYVVENPAAADADRAFAWLFETARRNGWEAEALPLVERYAARPEPLPPVKALASQVQAVGFARQGKADLALEAFDNATAAVGLRAANEALDLATTLATALQSADRQASARDVYDRMLKRFFLNPGVRQFCENRSGKLELLGKDAPDLGVEDLEGKSFSWADYRGKLVLVDFWATNCPPCLEEFPTLKQLYADYHRQGFEIVGISLDDERAPVDALQEKARLPWRLTLSRTDRDATRERFRVVTIPSMFLVDAEGRIQYVDVRGEELRRVVERRLKTAP